MNGDNVVIVIEGGIVTEVYSENANAKIVVIDIDNNKIGEDYIFAFSWPETQFNDEEIKGLMGEQYENYFDEES